MQKNADLYNFTQNLQGAMFQAAAQQFMAGLSEEEKANRPTPPVIMQLRRGYAESPGWMMVQVTEFDPEPLTVEKFRKRAVYSAPRLVQAILELLMSEGWLDRQGDAYSFTDAGREVQQRRADIMADYFGNFEPLTRKQMIRLEDLAGRIIQASLKTDHTWSLVYSRNRAPADDASPAHKLIQYGSDFNAFRDDAHMVAYNALNIPGYEWEAFNFVASEQASDAKTLFEQLNFRGWTTNEWQTMLDNLVHRGLLALNSQSYSATVEGKTVLQNVESRTDDLFYAPWDVLSDAEYNELIALMQAMHDACTNVLNG